MITLKNILLLTILIGSSILYSCTDEDDDCLTCEAFQDDIGFPIESIDICIGEEDEHGEIVTEEYIESTRALYVLAGATCN